MDNLSTLQRAGIALVDSTFALRNATATMAFALSSSLDMALVATVKAKGQPFLLRDYAHKPVTAKGKNDGALRNAQFTAIMEQAIVVGEPTAEEYAAIKTGFNKAFPAALYMAEHGGAYFDALPEGIADGFVLNEEGEIENVPLLLACACFDKEGKLTESGETLVERIIAMFSPEKGPEMTREEAIEQLATRRVVSNGKLNRRYGVHTRTVTELLALMGKLAEAEGLKWESTGTRKPRNGMETLNAETSIKAFDAFLSAINGDDEASVTLNNEGVKALQALQAKLAAAIKAIGKAD